jgi:hypothetical protein
MARLRAVFFDVGETIVDERSRTFRWFVLDGVAFVG